MNRAVEIVLAILLFTSMYFYLIRIQPVTTPPQIIVNAHPLIETGLLQQCLSTPSCSPDEFFSSLFHGKTFYVAIYYPNGTVKEFGDRSIVGATTVMFVVDDNMDCLKIIVRTRT